MPNTEGIFTNSEQTKKTIKKNTSSVQQKGRLFFIITFIIIVLVGIFLFAGISGTTSSASYVLKTWNESIVNESTIKNTISSSAIIELRNKETLLSPQTSQVSAVFVSEGDLVKKGQKIAQLASADLEWALVVATASYEQLLRDAVLADTDYDFNIRQQDIAIKTAERNVKNAEDTVVKTKGLYERSIASSSEVVTAENTFADLQDSLELAKISREQTTAKYVLNKTNRETSIEQKKKEITDLKQDIEECTIRTNSSGRVYTLSVAVGDRIPSYASVAVIADPLDIQIGIDVAENRISEVALSNPVLITIGSSSAKGLVKSIGTSATTSSTTSTSTVRVVADFIEVPSSAIVGGSVATEIVVGSIPHALVVPRGPFLSSGSYSSVYVISEKGTATKKTATFGLTDGSMIQVISGLELGDRIITSAYQDFIHLDEITLAK